MSTNTNNNETVAEPVLVNPIDSRFSIITKYHYFIFIILFLSKIPAMWHILNLMILNPAMSYTCEIDKTIKTGACPCNNPVWNRTVFTETAQTKFGLICDQKYQISLSESLAYFGMLVGALFYGLLSDRFGRLAMYCVAYLNIGIAGIFVGISPNMISFFIFRFLEGLGAGGSIVTSFVLCIECAGNKFRETITALYHFPINAGHISIAGVSYIFRNSFTFQIVISIPAFFFVLNWFCIAESPIWLLNNNYKERAIKAMERIARFNKQPDPTIAAEIEQYCSRRPAQAQIKAKLTDVFRHKHLTINFLCMAYLCFVCGMGYYGVSQYISKMSTNIHLNIALSGTLVVPGTIASVYLLNKTGRKPFLLSTSIVSGLFIILAAVIPKSIGHGWPRVICACISNCFFFMSFIIVFLYNVEMFPTQVRNSVLGLLSLLSRAGMMAAPQINSLSPTAGGLIFGVLALGGGALTFFLPETKNRDLPSSMEEAEASFRRRQ